MFKIEKLKTYVINLDKRPDRLSDIKLPLKWERFVATDGQIFLNEPPNKRGILGCHDSHLRLIDKIKSENYNYYLIFEDDIEVCNNFVGNLESVINKLPEDWELLFLGGWNVGDKKPYCDNIDIAEKVYCMHAYIFKSSIVNKLYDKYNSRKYKVDVLLAELLPELKAYICNPTIAWQKPGFSDIVNKVTDNKHLR